MRAEIDRRGADISSIGERVPFGRPSTIAPWQLWLFGEEAIPAIDFAFFVKEGQTAPTSREMAEVELCRRLFPEADIEWRLLILRSDIGKQAGTAAAASPR
ncbi:MAG: hypothetical protein AB7O59_17975 [Pirellulales bacterium]